MQHSRPALMGLCVFTALAACKVEPPEPVDFDAGFPDARADAGRDAGPTKDSGVAPDCREGDAGCAAGLSCTRAGTCRAASSTCSATLECAVPDLCVDGRCGAGLGACTETSACASIERCAPSQVCIPDLIDDATFRERCEDNADCGPGGVCSGGACGCSEAAPCARGLACVSGACFEPFFCERNADCFAGNTCVDRFCTRSTNGCVYDEANDEPESPTALREMTATYSICGEDVDWYSFNLAAGTGARVIVRTDRTRSTARSQIFDAASVLDGGDDVPGTVHALHLLGVSVFEVSSSTAAQDLLLRVRGLDVSGSYTIDLQRIAPLCGGDFLDLYGDRDRAESLLLPPDVEVDLIACVGDVDVVRVPVERSDLWRFFPRFSRTGSSLSLNVEGQTKIFTASSTAPLTPPAPAEADEWTVSVSARSVPSVGQPYTLELLHQAGPRIEACAAAMPLNGRSTINLAGARDIGAPFCDTAVSIAAVDRVVRVDPPRAGAVIFASARPLSGTATVALGLLSNCADDERVLGCGTGVRPGGSTAIEAVATSTRPLYLLVSTQFAGDAPQVELDVRFDEPGDYTCRTGGVRPIVANGEITVTTEAATNTVEIDSSGQCTSAFSAGHASGPDRILSVSLGTGQRAAFELTGPIGGLIWAGTDCNDLSGSCVGGANIEFGSAAKMVLAPTGGAANYLIAVDNADPFTDATYTLRTVLQPQCISDAECRVMPGSMQRCDDYRCADAPSNDACGGAILLPLTNGRVTIQSSNGAANDDFTSSTCGGSGGQDVVYAVDVPAPANVLRVQITRATWDPILSLRRDTCGSVTAEVGCTDDPEPPRPAVTALPVVRYPATGTGVPAGRYYIIVDAYSGSGPFTLEVELQ